MKYKLVKDNNQKNKYNGKLIRKLKNKKLAIPITIFGIVVCIPMAIITAKKIDETNENYKLKKYLQSAITSTDKIIEKTGEFAEKMGIDNPMMLCGFIEMLVNNGHLSYTGKYQYDSVNNGAYLYDFLRYREIDVIMGLGVCRSEASLVNKVLNECGYESYSINNELIYENEKYNHEFTLICYRNSTFIYDITNRKFFVFKDNKFKPITLGSGNGSANMRIIPTYLAHQIDFDDILKIYGNLIKNENNITEEEIGNEYFKGIELYYSLDENVINDFVLSIEDNKNIIANNVLSYKKR